MCLTHKLVIWVLAVPHPCVLHEAGIIAGSTLVCTDYYSRKEKSSQKEVSSEREQG